MEIEINSSNGDLKAFKGNSLLFYSTVKINIFNRIIKVFNYADILVLELKITDLIFKSSYKILFQNNDLISHVARISYDDIFFDENESLKKRFDNRIISFNWNYSYFHKNIKIAQVKHNTKKYPCIMELNIEEKNLNFLDQILIHILSTRIADPNDN
ncbi:hypothetical protein [Flavobacterium luteolum]|uniref:hypothetical protein n=1 Tax=Flavobacterium luteolum TaxID=3003259 RepID=UPI00248E7BBC|nr:hypothetical protein [Flavobacterium luteolum]